MSEKSPQTPNRLRQIPDTLRKNPLPAAFLGVALTLGVGSYLNSKINPPLEPATTQTQNLGLGASEIPQSVDNINKKDVLEPTDPRAERLESILLKFNARTNLWKAKNIKVQSDGSIDIYLIRKQPNLDGQNQNADQADYLKQLKDSQDELLANLIIGTDSSFDEGMATSKVTVSEGSLGKFVRNILEMQRS